MKPIDYGLSSDALTDVAERNLRIVASTMLYLVRRVAIQRGRGIMVRYSCFSFILYICECIIQLNHIHVLTYLSWIYGSFCFDTFTNRTE